MAPSNEAGLVRSIVREVARRYPLAFIFKVVGHPYQMVGVPDLLVCVEGRLVGIEVKYQRPGESVEHALSRVSAQQEFQMEAIRRAGGVAGAVTSVEAALELVEQSLSKI